MTAAAAYILIALWPAPGGALEERRVPAISRQDCEIAAHAVVAGIWVPLWTAEPARQARCEAAASPEAAGFKPGWACIRNYNCPSG